MATTITIKGDSASGTAALDKIIASVTRADTGSSKLAVGFNKADKASDDMALAVANLKARLDAMSLAANRSFASMKAYEAQAAMSAATTTRVAVASAATTGRLTKMAPAIIGVGSAFGLQGASISSAVASLGAYGVAGVAVGTTLVSMNSIVKDGAKFFDNSTQSIGENRNAITKMARDGILWLGLLGEASTEADKRDALFAANQMQRMKAANEARKRFVEGKRQEGAVFAKLAEEQSRRLLDQSIGEKAVQEFGKSKLTIEKQLAEITRKRTEIFKEGAAITGPLIEDDRKRANLHRILRNLTAEENALKVQGRKLDAKAVKAAAEKRSEAAEAAREFAQHMAEHKRFAAERQTAEKSRLAVLEKQKQSRKDELALLFETKQADVGVGGAGSDGQQSGLPKIQDRGVGVPLGGGIGRFFGQANRPIGQFDQAPRNFGINVRPRAPRGGGGNTDPDAAIRDLVGGIDRKDVLKRVADNRLRAGFGTLDRKAVRRDVFGGGASSDEFATAQKQIAKAEIDRLAKQKNLNAEMADAAKAKIDAIAAHDQEIDQLRRDAKAMKDFVTAIANGSRGRRQRSGR